ncbi:sugar phosphate isomerase/epimerase family protein [Paraclostridium sordellii]|uniref:sugar phosphate isomerase/epimerase family protein n=1 Tax=Paraclostridium sordellii TaxID=1505 RepID=UPI0005E8522A|nr:sugar phosphate isomerase/epimerase [Paeniclostridium sordellii]CEQ19170.1 sugar isomerase / endonuclease [[Clostridium] sordellii] [Paeniclostridium sordellii]
MRFGISALVHEINKAIEICKINDFINHIEIGIDNLYECKAVLNYIEEFKSNDISIGIHLPMELNTCENIEYIRNSWVKYIEEVKEKLNPLDIKYFNIHLGYVIKTRFDKNKNKYLDNTVDFIEKVNVSSKVFIENTYTKGGDICNIGTTVDEFEYIFNNITRKNTEFCYDTGHNLINSDKYIYNLREKINLVHLSDNNGINDSHDSIGAGKLDLEEVRELINLKPEFIVLEVRHENINESIKIVERFI